MNEEQYFLEAINASEPNADLIYADWLEEQGRSEADEIREPAIFTLCKWLRSWSGHRRGSCTNRSNQVLSRSQSLSDSLSWYRSRSQSSSHYCNGSGFYTKSTDVSHSRSFSRFCSLSLSHFLPYHR